MFLPINLTKSIVIRLRMQILNNLALTLVEFKVSSSQLFQ